MQKTTNSKAGLFEDALEALGHRDEIPNHERGCGDLDADSAYLRSDAAAFAHPDGDIPTFVTFTEPVPYREGHFRTFKRIAGDRYLSAVLGDVTTEDPAGEFESARERAIHDAPIEGTDSTPGATEMESQDLLMHIGGSYYENPEDFIEEARVQGVSKKIPVSGSQAPPRIVPFRTRLFLIHPKAILVETTTDDGEPDTEFIPGVVGYTYLTRTVYTEQADGGFPSWAEDFEDQNLLHRVSVGPKVGYDDPEHPEHDRVTGSDEDSEEETSDTDSSEEETSDTDGESFEERRAAFADSPLGFHDLRRVCAQNDLLSDVTHPSKDDLLDALAESDIPKPTVTGGDDE